MSQVLTSTCFAQYYPVDVLQYEENGSYEIQKTYILPEWELPTEEMKESFILDGYEYHLKDMILQPVPEYTTQDVVKMVEISTKTNKVEDIIPLLDKTMAHTTEDGFMGELQLDITSLSISVGGYGSSTKTLTETRTYPNLSSSDMSHIPQTITANGLTYKYASVDWQTSNEIGIDGHSLANRFTAVVNYTATQTSSYVSGYTVKADYVGTLSRISQDTSQYTAIFRGTPMDQSETPEVVAPVNPEEIPDTEEPEESLSTTETEVTGFQWQYVAYPVVLFVFPVLTYFGIKWIKKFTRERRENRS